MQAHPIRSGSAGRHRSTRPTLAKDPISRLPTASQPHTLHWRSSGAAAPDGPPRPKVISAWEFASGDPRAAQIAALNAKLPMYGGAGPVITSYGTHGGGRASTNGSAGPQPAPVSRPSSAAVLRPSQQPYRSSAAQYASNGTTGSSKPAYYASSAAALAATASAASHASAASTARVGGYSMSTRPASATMMRSMQSSGAAPTAVLRPASASNRFGASTGAAIVGGYQQHHHTVQPHHSHSHAHEHAHPQYAYVQPPPSSHRHAQREPQDDGSAGAHARRALAQPAWSPAELQQRSQYVGTIADDVQRHYSFGRQLGSGSFGEVREATHRLTDGAVAIKKIDKLKAATARLRTRIAMEIRLHQRLRHPNIVHLYEVIEGARNVYLVMEQLPTTLLALLKEKKVLSEAEARPLFGQLLAALGHCHRNSIVHRDIKLENLLLDESRTGLKLCDFGFAVMTRTHKLTVACGSPSYNCPEIVAKRQYHGVPADVWSSGVLLYVLLVGAFPFTGSTHESLNRRILAGSYKTPSELSASAQDLIRRCLQVDPERRASLAEMRDHEWMREGGAAAMRAPPRLLEPTEQDVQGAFESLGLGRADARLAFEQLRRGERTHATTAYELLAAKRRQQLATASLVAHGSAGAQHGHASSGSASRRPSMPAVAAPPAAPLATAGANERAGGAADAGARQQPAQPANGGGTDGPTVGPLRATVVKPQLAVGGSAHPAQRLASLAAARATAPASVLATAGHDGGHSLPPDAPLLATGSGAIETLGVVAAA